MAKKNVHVVPKGSGAGWTVKQSGDTKSSHRTQQAAVDKATPVAKRDKVDLVIHGKDGRIRSKDSYGNETGRHDTEH